MEPIIDIDGTLINLRNVDFIDFKTQQIRFNHGKGGDWARLNCADVDDFAMKVMDEIRKLNSNQLS